MNKILRLHFRKYVLRMVQTHSRPRRERQNRTMLNIRHHPGKPGHKTLQIRPSRQKVGSRTPARPAHANHHRDRRQKRVQNLHASEVPNTWRI